MTALMTYFLMQLVREVLCGIYHLLTLQFRRQFPCWYNQVSQLACSQQESTPGSFWNGVRGYEPSGLLTTLHHIHICFPEQGGNMVTTMGWGFSDFRHLFCFTLLINKACMYHNHIPLMYIFNSPANECRVSFSFKLRQWKMIKTELTATSTYSMSAKPW